MKYTCVALYSLDEKCRGFVFPAFSRPDKNQVYFQDLSIDGKIERFIAVDTSSLFSAPTLPPALNVSIGDFGLLAFIDDQGGVEIGIPVALAQSIDAAEVADPFTRLELSSLCADKGMQRKALRDCGKAFSGSDRFERWEGREKRLFRKVIQEFSKDDRDISEGAKILEKDFRKLEANLGAGGWTKEWLRLWGQNFDRRRLVGISYLRQDSGHSFGDEGPSIYKVIVGHEYTDESLRRSLSILEGGEIGSALWFQFYTHLYYNFPKLKGETIEVGLRFLERQIENSAPSVHWINIWRILYRSITSRDQISYLGCRMINKHGVFSQACADFVALPLSREFKYYESIEVKLTRWLIENVKSETVWATLFIRSFKFGSHYPLDGIGLQWLQRLGGNTTLWVDVWHLYRQRLPANEFNELALDWLARARRDMRAWVDVFMELMDDPDVRDMPRFSDLGSDWLGSRQGNARNRHKISQALKYLEQRRL